MTRPTGHFTWWALVARNVSLFIFLPFIFIHKKIQQVEREHRSFTLLPCLLTDEHKCFCFCRFARPGPTTAAAQLLVIHLLLLEEEKEETPRPPASHRFDASVFLECVFAPAYLTSAGAADQLLTSLIFISFIRGSVGIRSVGRSVATWNFDLSWMQFL